MADGEQVPADANAQPPGAGAPEVAPGGVSGLEADASEDPVTRQLDMAYATDAPGVAESQGETDLFADERATADPARDLLVYAGLVIAAISMGLLALAWFARRYVADPLLR